MIGTTINRIRELYEQNPEAKKDFKGIHRENYFSSLDDFLKRLEQDPPQDFSMQTLDTYEQGLDLAIVLAHIPAEIIYSELGDDALIWTWVRYIFFTQKNVLARGIQRVTGRDYEKIEKSRLTAWRLLSTYKAELVKAIYDLNEVVIGGVDDFIDLPNYLKQNARTGICLSDNRLNDYSLDPLITKGDNSEGYEITWSTENNQNGDKSYAIWLDSPAGLALTYKREPNAVVGFLPSDVNTLMIYQLQGVRPKKIGTGGYPIKKMSSRGLMPLDWQKLLVSVVETIGQRLGYSQIGIQSGHNNKWTIPSGRKSEIHLPLDKALEKYDVVAKRLEFQQADNKNWYRKIANL